MQMKMVIRALLLLMLPWGVFANPAINEEDVEGMYGELHVFGSLTESACRLDMASAWQDVDLGNVGTADLKYKGDKGTPVVVQFHLLDCLVAASRARDEKTGDMTWSSDRPAITLRFMALGNPDEPDLIQVQGVSGIALRLTDEEGHDIRLGSRGHPHLLTPRQNTLTYFITPVRTNDRLNPGGWQAQINVGLEYD